MFSHFPPRIQAGHRFSLHFFAFEEVFANFLNFVSESSSPLRIGFGDGKVFHQSSESPMGWGEERELSGSLRLSTCSAASGVTNLDASQRIGHVTNHGIYLAWRYEPRSCYVFPHVTKSSGSEGTTELRQQATWWQVMWRRDDHWWKSYTHLWILSKTLCVLLINPQESQIDKTLRRNESREITEVESSNIPEEWSPATQMYWSKQKKRNVILQPKYVDWLILNTCASNRSPLSLKFLDLWRLW